ncbi:MAG: hypothetical protein R2854_09440 [Caldilineaceae bacterium]
MIQNRANTILARNLTAVQRLPLRKALHAPSVTHYDFVMPYARPGQCGGHSGDSECRPQDRGRSHGRRGVGYLGPIDLTAWTSRWS